VNARTAAELLNSKDVRQQLGARGIDIPDDTHFLAGLHVTTTDEVTLFDEDVVPPSHSGDIDRLRGLLTEAGRITRAERAGALGLEDLANSPGELLSELRFRSSSWAETRPEWGLANNASFIVAPRSRTRGCDLEGRAFLHDYDWRADTDGSILERLMTGPMIVTNWINMQYYASTVDNQKFGSGNKVLHNVVGGGIGVFEGNGGDLRIGLSKQSLHDGTRWIHTPLRLSVFIEAPRLSIEAVVDKHEVVRHLSENQWLYLFRIDPESHVVERYFSSEWSAFG
jgi:hypothetical protein